MFGNLSEFAYHIGVGTCDVMLLIRIGFQIKQRFLNLGIPAIPTRLSAAPLRLPLHGAVSMRQVELPTPFSHGFELSRVVVER